MRIITFSYKNTAKKSKKENKYTDNHQNIIKKSRKSPKNGNYSIAKIITLLSPSIIWT